MPLHCRRHACKLTLDERACSSTAVSWVRCGTFTGAQLIKPSLPLPSATRVTGFLRWPFDGGDSDRSRAVLGSCALAVVVVWVCFNLARLFWSFWPEDRLPPPPSDIANPIVPSSATSTGPQLDLDSLLGLGLFGEPLNQVDAAVAGQPLASDVPEDIEAAARETRLDLLLVGTLAESGNDLGTAVIEIRGQQMPYRVGDELPIGGNVSIAKVLPQRVVLDNNGTYELLNLFEDAAPVAAVASSNAAPQGGPRGSQAPSPAGASQFRSVSSQGAKRAAAYRQQLYSDPEMLADLVQVQAVQGPEGLRGYRVAPGKNAQEFMALGFQSGDVVTAVNDLPLSDPGNGVRLYSLMREASEARFTIERDGSEMTLSVDLQAAEQEQ